MTDKKVFNIIVVDDERDLEMLFKMQFRKWLKTDHFTLTYFESALDVLDYLESNNDKIDLILSDINMPKMSGLELLEIVKEKYAIDVMVISAYDSDDYKIEAKKLGAVEYFEKPLKFKELKEDIISRYNLTGFPV